MRYNQLSYYQPSLAELLLDFQNLGLDLSENASGKENLEAFLRQTALLIADKDEAIRRLAADQKTNLLDFFQSDQPLTDEVFYTVILQLLGFVPDLDFTDWANFIDQIALPVRFDDGNLLASLHQLLATRTKSGNTLIDLLISQNLLPVDNNYHFFNGKSLATFDTNDLIKEVVYVDSGLDTDEDGQTDLIKVSIMRPRTAEKLPVMMTASPYHQGINDKASDQKLYKMEGELAVKPTGQLTIKPHQPVFPASQPSTVPTSPAQETFSHISTYTLNDYMLARGFANIYVSGVGTAGSQGFMTSGDYQLIASYKAVIDWLNGRATAYTSHKRLAQVKADWTTGKVVTTGISYLGTMSNGLATTGVDGLEVIIAEAGISSWYDYYRENGLVSSPGGYPGEDLDSLTALTHSRSLIAGDWVNSRADYERLLQQQVDQLDRESGDYNQFWEDRNYLPHAHKVKATVVHTHGLQDWNVKPKHVYQFLKALPTDVTTHTFLHQGAHVYMNNWQSIDFRESMNALLSQKLLGQDNPYQLPKVIWQDNSADQTWQELSQFGHQETKTFKLGDGEKIITNHYEEETFKSYGKSYQTFKKDLFEGRANAISIDLPIAEALLVNGTTKLKLTLKSSTNKGLVAAQLLDYGQKKRHNDRPALLSPKSVDNGRNHSRENLEELTWQESPYRVVTKGMMNLQNREGLLTISQVLPDQWLTLELDLQPTIHQLSAGDCLRLVIYTTDFEHSIRDNSDYQLTLDLGQSSLELPVNDYDC